MFQKIRYRLTYNYAGKLNKSGMAPVALECRQGIKKIYLSSKVMLEPSQWGNGFITNHENANKLTVYLVKWKNQIEEIELNALLKGKHLSLSQLKIAVKSGVHESANLRDFTMGVIENSDRKESTKRGYEYLMNEIEEDYGRMTLDDVTYDWVLKWKRRMGERNLSDNTIKGRMKLMRCVCSEAVKRNILDEDPFKYITIGNMTPKAVWLDMKEIKKIEHVKLKGREAVVRDLFLLGCFSGLRWSDLSSLEEAEIKDGLLRKMMKKTNHEVTIPIKTLFWGKGMEIIERYSSNIKRLSHVCCNATANKMIKEIARKAGVNKSVSFHWARKSCSSNLQLLGMSVGDVSTILGHTDVQVTSTHYSFSKDQSAQKQSQRIFRQKLDNSPKDSLNVQQINDGVS